MIEYIEGEITSHSPTSVVIDKNGIGYALLITLNTFTKIKDRSSCKLFTHLHVKLEAQTMSGFDLFGFFEEEERRIFRQLISVSGIGPNTARTMLSSLSAQEVRNAISSGDVATLKKTKGIGEKVAMRVIVDLKDKISKETGISSQGLNLSGPTINTDGLAALLALGFTKAASEKAMDQILRRSGPTITVEALIREALKII